MNIRNPDIPTAYANELSEVYLAGFQRGYNLASWQDIPEIGSKLPRHIDYQGLGTIETAQDQADAMQMLASEAESSNRDFSPFEFTAHELNEREDSEDAWEAYDSGIADGINANIQKRIA
jgi:hypothetical protein